MTDYGSGTPDPYLDPALGILRNKTGAETQDELDLHETLLVAARTAELPVLTEGENADLDFWRQIHFTLFQDVYDWAGEIRTIRLGKDGSAFAYPEHIRAEADRLFAHFSALLTSAANAEAFVPILSEFYAELNALHPFREGNGRTQKVLFSRLAESLGYDIAWDSSAAEPATLTKAIIESFHGRLDKLEVIFRQIVTPSAPAGSPRHPA